MSISPSNILLKIDKLKKWQEEQQKRLAEEHNKRLQTTPTLFKPLEIQEKNDPHKNVMPTMLSKQPITSSSRNTAPNLPKPKQPFLRKGVGLARFCMSPGDQLKPNLRSVKPRERQVSNTEEINVVPIEKKAGWQFANGNSDLTPLSTKNLPCLQSKLYEEASESNLNASERELIVFEKLERRVDQTSFCSTNSSVLGFISSTPHKDSPPKAQEEKQTRSQKAYKQLDVGTSPLESQEVSDEEPLGQVNNKNIQENNRKFQQIEDYEQKLQNQYLSLIEKAIQFKDYVVQDNPAADGNDSTTSNDVDDITEENTLRQFDDETKWSDTEVASNHSVSEISSIKSDLRVSSKVDVETMTERENDDFNAEDAEKETKRLRAESLKVGKMKDQLEQQKREFERYKREMLKYIEDEKSNNGVMVQEERRKLAKEKMVFEQYVKDLQNKPNRKEREEISALKSEVATLQETQKLKETKNGTTQARFRNQIKVLERKNSELAKEVEKLTKQNARLVATQNTRKNPSDTKILHEINKNLTKLAQDQLEKFVKPSEEDLTRTGKAREKENKTYANAKESLSKSLEEFYEETFGQPVPKTSRQSDPEAFAQSRLRKSLESENVSQTKKSDRNETICEDGTKKIEYNNGNIKTISPDGNLITFKYFNGDVKDTNLLKGTVKYYYHKSQVNHTTNADGSELIEYPDGQVEKRHKSGECEVYYSNGIKRVLKSNSEEICYPDGTIVFINDKGERTIQLMNGQREVHTSEHKRREYPDGTVKILYPNGIQETRYANGRMRIKDKNGHLLMDSQNNSENDTIKH